MELEGLVVQSWVETMPWKKQSAFFSSLRGPDNRFSPQCKRVVKFLRRASQYDADSTTDYMVDKEIDFKELERELEFLPLHYVGHLIEALHLVKVYAPMSSSIRAGVVLGWFTETFHLEYVKEEND